MIEPSFIEDLRLLASALRHDGFRFVLIGHNRRSIYKDISDWLRSQFPDRPFLEFRFEGKDYRQTADELLAFKKGIVLVPDFDWLFRDGNEAACVAFNQRRDAFARLDLALVCFVQPGNFVQVPNKVPDWWSLRSLELEFHSDAPDTAGEFLIPEFKSSSLGSETWEDKEAEIERLLRQIEAADAGNKPLLLSLNSQAGELYFQLAAYENAFSHFEKSLVLSQEIGDREVQGTTLNNLAGIARARGNYDTALLYLQQSLKITQEIGDRQGEEVTLNNISQIYDAKGDYDTALVYLQQSLKISQEIGDQQGEGAALNNLGSIAYARGNYATALGYLQQSLKIRQEIGDIDGMAMTINNISQIHHAKGDYDTAQLYLEQSLKIQQEIGDISGMAITLNNISQIYGAKGDYDSAQSYLEQSLKIQQEIGDQQGKGVTLSNLAGIARARGNYDTALLYLQQSLKIQQEIGDISGKATTLSNIGVMLFELNRLEEAMPPLLQSRDLLHKTGSPKVKTPAGYLGAIIEKIGQAKYDQVLQNLQNK